MRAKIIAISIITAIAAPAIAQRGGPIDRLDTDDDGFISREEFEIPNHRKAQRADADADGDGAVTQEEAENFAFSKVDEDGDGYLSREEMRKQMRKHRGAKKGKGRRDRRPEHD